MLASSEFSEVKKWMVVGGCSNDRDIANENENENEEGRIDVDVDAIKYRDGDGWKEGKEEYRPQRIYMHTLSEPNATHLEK